MSRDYKNIKVKIMDEEKEYNWLIFAQSYILLARLACQELLDNREDKHSKVVGENLEEFKSIKYNPTDLFIPIIFNIKHGVEVFIKTIRILNIGKYEQGHDIKELFSELKKIVTQDIKSLYSIKWGDVDNLPEKLNKLEELILKYYHCHFLNSGKNIVDINDVANDVFRYPENKAGVEINLEFIDVDNIKQIKEDIDSIYTLFNDVGYIIDFYRK